MSRWSLQSCLVSRLLIKTQLSSLLVAQKSISAVAMLFYPVDHSSVLLPALNCGTAAMGGCHVSEQVLLSWYVQNTAGFQRGCFGLCGNPWAEHISLTSEQQAGCRINVVCSCFQHMGVLKCWAAETKLPVSQDRRATGTKAGEG